MSHRSSGLILNAPIFIKRLLITSPVIVDLAVWVDMVIPRVITAFFLVPIIIPIIWMGSLPFFIFILGICFLCYWEYALMADHGGYPNQLIVGMAGTLLLVFSLYLDGAAPWGPITKAPSPMFVLMAWTFVSLNREFFRREKGHSLLRIVTTMGGVIICALFLGHLILLRDMRWVAGEGVRFVGREMTYFLVFVVWATDVGAWLVGRTWGRIRIAPLVSPGKTLEGSIGGMVFASLVGWVFRDAFLKISLGRGEAVVYAVIISIVAQLSDLAESLIKRSFGVKNSSDLLPGHGGIMDRFDSFIFTAPFFYYLLVVTGRFQ